jgi:A/G-specific adenine glycosylase
MANLQEYPLRILAALDPPAHRRQAGRRPSRAAPPAVAPGPGIAPGRLTRPLLRWFSRRARALPWRSTTDAYAIWISEIMLQQTQVQTVIPYWERWMRALPDVQALASASPDRVLKLWEGLGYYRRARHLQAAAREICQSRGGRLPERFAEWLSLPGIGRYTAGAICSLAYNHATPVVDGNVTRVLTRLLGIRQDPDRPAVRRQLWATAEALVREASRHAHPDRRACAALNQALMELGAVVCTPLKPHCQECPVRGACSARRHGWVESIPKRARRAASLKREVAVFIVERGGRFLVSRRSPDGVNARLWELPNCQLARGASALLQSAEQTLGLPLTALEPVGTFKHSITRYRLNYRAFRVTLSPEARRRRVPGRWASPGELEKLPLAGAQRRILEQHFPGCGRGG